jgi:hypothetical protein
MSEANPITSHFDSRDGVGILLYRAVGIVSRCHYATSGLTWPHCRVEFRKHIVVFLCADVLTPDMRMEPN